MRSSILTTMIVIGSLIGSLMPVNAEEPTAAPVHQGIQLSPELRDLLLAEMREITSGIQVLAVSLSTGDWKTIQETSNKIRASFIMEKKLSPSQREELERVLPDRFKELDGDFHMRAGKLGAAAAAHDAELVAFQYSRLIESCAACHAAYAKSRFPGFSSPKPGVHDHGAVHKP